MFPIHINYIDIVFRVYSTDLEMFEYITDDVLKTI